MKNYPKTEQEIFDRVWDHFVVKKSPKSTKHSVSGPGERCCYRSPDGARCAVGVCIPDEDYRPWFDDEKYGTDINDLIIGGRLRTAITPPELCQFLEQHEEFLTELQKIHDYKFERFEDELRFFAGQYNLTVPA